LCGGLFVFLGVFLLQRNGSLEFLELGAYDWFIRLEPKYTREDPRITVIEITEKDIHAIGRWPLSDETLARAMNILLTGKPRAIGLDIYRDILVPPGSRELKSIFAENPKVIGVNTFGDKGVKSPAIIGNPEQVGFNDILVDPGGIVRRALIFLDDGANSYSSFALRLATLYLQGEGIALESDPRNPQHVRLKETTIKPFEANDGGYINADAKGYQFLMDYEDAAIPFRTYSLSALLSGGVPAEAIANRVILIGVSAQSVKDYFYTPLSRGFEEAQQVSGVDLHGHIVSQLLRFACDRSRPMATMPAKYRTAWLLFWSLSGGLLGLRTRSAWHFSLFLTGGLVLLFFGGFAAFLSRWWIPLVPPALSFFLAAAVVTALMSSRE
jgi:adenylate cyclase